MRKLMFYNANYNYKDPMGQSKYIWGVTYFDLESKAAPQIFERYPEIDIKDVYNFNLTAFNSVPDAEGENQ